MKQLDPLPARLQILPTDPRGYPVPWFVAKVTGTDGVEAYDFRVMDSDKFVRAIKRRLCWVCGQPLGQWLAFGIGPMCTISRTISEPPSHRECMIWSIKNCPFLANPNAVRNVVDKPAEASEAAGIALKRNPGVMALWITRTFETFNVDGLRKQLPLITVGEPTSVSWWREGRSATRAEVQESIDSGMPNLMTVAQSQGDFAVQHLGIQYKRALAYLPAADSEAVTS